MKGDAMKTAVCIGCGCVDQHACVDVFGTACHWSAVNRERGVGICSQCSELTSGHVRPIDKPDPEFSARRFADLLEPIYDPHEAARWFERPQPVLKGKTPRALVISGQIGQLRAAVNTLLEGVYL
jgi:uncharacterized protein (DUF2384 family)